MAELIDVGQSGAGVPVVRGFTTIVQRGARVGRVGPNGAGKTTLLRLMLGEIAPDAGIVRLGQGRTDAYFDQLRVQLDDEASVQETISPGSEWIEIAGLRTHVMTYLARFLFDAQRARSPVRTLSGGERNRLLLARLFARPANLIVLDEPTNDLDIESLELLEELLAEYDGTVLLVSHDRAFLDNVVTQTIAWEGGARWREYAGGYEDLLRARERAGVDDGGDGGVVASGARGAGEARRERGHAARASAEPAQAQRAPEDAGGGTTTASEPASRAKLTYKEQRELDGLPDRIAALEHEQREIGGRLADPALYAREPREAQALNERYAAIEEELMGCLERWETLGSRSSATSAAGRAR